MISKLDIDISTSMKDRAFSIVHFGFDHYFGHIPLWSTDVLNSMFGMANDSGGIFDVFYVIEDKLSHTPVIVSDSVEQLQIYADLHNMKLSE